MNKIILLLIACMAIGNCYAQDELNLRLINNYDRGSTAYSGSWVYVNDSGEEYGLVGSNSGTAIYPLEEGFDDELAFIPGPTSRWREYTVIGDHAYVTTEGDGEGQGLQVLALGELPDTAYLVTTFDSTFIRSHILQKDIFNPDEPYIYVSGTNTSRGVHIIDVSDPANPVEVGVHNPGFYIHDVHVRGDRMYTFQIFQALIEVVDISDKTNPTVITTFDDPGTYTHSGWTTADNNYLLVADERNGFDGRVFDIRDLDNITEVSTFTSNPQAFVHNPYVRGDFAYLAHNAEGLRIYDIVDPSNPVEVGYYDTVTEANPGSGGLWSACPYIPSGKVIGGDRDLGLMVWEPTEVYASRFLGTVRDAATFETIDSVAVTIIENGKSLLTNGVGEYRSGIPGEMEINLIFEKEGYITEQRTVALTTANQQIVDVLMTQNTVSTNTLTDNANISVWPNPTADQINVAYFGDFAIASIQLHDLAGKKVRNIPVMDNQIPAISMRDLMQGFYILNMVGREGQNIGSRKIEVLKAK